VAVPGVNSAPASLAKLEAPVPSPVLPAMGNDDLGKVPV